MFKLFRLHSKKSNDMSTENRRQSERLNLKNVDTVTCVAENVQSLKMNLLNVSDHGCALKVPYDPQVLELQSSDKFKVRMYLKSDTYLSIHLEIANIRPVKEDDQDYLVLGCTIEKTSRAFFSYQKFISFLESYSEVQSAT
jgi:hypothetical protein